MFGWCSERWCIHVICCYQLPPAEACLHLRRHHVHITMPVVGQQRVREEPSSQCIQQQSEYPIHDRCLVCKVTATTLSRPAPYATVEQWRRVTYTLHHRRRQSPGCTTHLCQRVSCIEPELNEGTHSTRRNWRPPTSAQSNTESIIFRKAVDNVVKAAASKTADSDGLLNHICDQNSEPAKNEMVLKLISAFVSLLRLPPSASSLSDK